MTRLHFKLGQDGVAKGLGSDACAVRNEKHGAIGHSKQYRMVNGKGGAWATSGLYNVDYLNFASCSVAIPSNNNKVARWA